MRPSNLGKNFSKLGATSDGTGSPGKQDPSSQPLNSKRDIKTIARPTKVVPKRIVTRSGTMNDLATRSEAKVDPNKAVTRSDTKAFPKATIKPEPKVDAKVVTRSETKIDLKTSNYDSKTIPKSGKPIISGARTVTSNVSTASKAPIVPKLRPSAGALVKQEAPRKTPLAKRSTVEPRLVRNRTMTLMGGQDVNKV